MVQNKTNLDFELLLQLAKGPSHLRELSRSLDIPHSTLMRRLDILINANVLDFSLIGRNKSFSIKNNLKAKNFLIMAERYKLQKLLDKYPKLSVILDDLLSSTSASLVILFGSYAKFSAKPSSDIDIYIQNICEEDKKKAERVYSSISVKTGPLDLESALIKEIIKNHVILRGEEEFYDKIRFFA